MTDTLNWAGSIELQATSWQGAIPAEVVWGPDSDGDYMVQILAEHRVIDGGYVYPAGCCWRFLESGASTPYLNSNIRIVNHKPVEQEWNEDLRGPRMSNATGKVISKYQMPVLERFTMKLPIGAQIIRMEDQGGMFWLWAVVDTNAPLEERHFHAYKTGAAMDPNAKLRYIGFCAVFVQMELGLYIFEAL